VSAFRRTVILKEKQVNRTIGAVKFLFMGPLILAFLFVINLLTSPGEWWVQWAALGIGYRVGDQPLSRRARARPRRRARRARPLPVAAPLSL
jgi:hypothetical protein